MASILELNLKRISENIAKLVPASITNIDDFLQKFSVKDLKHIDYNDLFKKLFNFLKNVKKRKEPDIVLCWFVYEKIIDSINNFGDNPNKVKAYIKQTLGFSEENPNVDFISKPKTPKDFDDDMTIPKDEDISNIINRDISKDKYIRSPIDQSYISELDYYQLRKEQYLKDYNINLSSDMPILHEIIMSEIQLARYDEYLSLNPEKYTDELRTKIFENLCKAQKTLGISREQRIDFEGTSNDTIADLVKEYEELRQRVPEIDTLFFLEELELLLQKYDRGAFRGTPELSEAVFTRITGLSIEQARKLLNDNKPLMEEIETKLKNIKL